MSSLKGKSILVTGGASGIGREAAILAGKRGALVTVADRDESGGVETVRLITEDNGTAQFVAVDIAQEASVASMVDAAVSAYGRLDGAFNNAAVAHSAIILHELPAEDYLRVIGINLVGTFFCMKHEIAAMLKTGGGAIVNTSSAAGLTAYPNAADYVSAKHGVVGLTKAGAVDYGTRGIRVNAVLPGGTMSPMLRKAIDKEPELEGYLIGLQPIGRLGQPIESAAAAIWLLSDEASFVTGACMSVDGGYTAA